MLFQVGAKFVTVEKDRFFLLFFLRKKISAIELNNFRFLIWEIGFYENLPRPSLKYTSSMSFSLMIMSFSLMIMELLTQPSLLDRRKETKDKCHEYPHAILSTLSGN